MPSAYIREMTIGEILRGTLRLYRRSFVPNTLAYALPNVPFSLVYFYGMMQQSAPAMIAAWLLVIPGAFISYTAITLCISDACVGNVPSLRRSFLRTRAIAGSLIVVSILQALVIFAGIVALLIPGVIFALWFNFAPIVVVLEGRTGRAALSRSRALGKGFYLRNLAVLALTMIVAGGIFFVGFLVLMLVAVGMAAVQVPAPIVGAVVWIIWNGLGWVVYPLLYVSLILTYYDLRARKEAFDSVALAAELMR